MHLYYKRDRSTKNIVIDFYSSLENATKQKYDKYNFQKSVKHFNNTVIKNYLYTLEFLYIFSFY